MIDFDNLGLGRKAKAWVGLVGALTAFTVPMIIHYVDPPEPASGWLMVAAGVGAALATGRLVWRIPNDKEDE